MIALDLACFADPTGVASTAIHVGRAVSKGIKVAKVANKLVKLVKPGSRIGKVTGNAAHNAAQYDKLRTHYKQSEKYGEAGVKELKDGRIRYYGEISPANNPGEMIGRRVVREWNPATGQKRTWQETIDQNGAIRQVRPDTKFTGGIKVHYLFDNNGSYLGKW